MKSPISALLLSLLCLFLLPLPAKACSCAWGGPFLVASRDAPLVVRGKVTRHDEGASPAMVVWVSEVLKGAMLDSGLLVQMGDGMACRPGLQGFPVGSEWILAINGPGSKPGSGAALSHCGEFWLRVEDGRVIGSIDGAESELKSMPLDVFGRKLRYPGFDEHFSGRVLQGRGYQRPFGERFVFILQPMQPDGWEILVKELGRDENLARLTPPLHFVPNPRFIEGWHLAEKSPGCAEAEAFVDGLFQGPRDFIFSPEVGKEIDGPGAGRSPEVEEVERIRSFGRGSLGVEKFKLQAADAGCPALEWLDFSVRLQGGY